MGDSARSVDTYARLFGVKPDIVRLALNNGTPMAPPSPAPAAPSGPAPGDPGFAASMMGGAPAPASSPQPRPAGPAPGEPGFNLADVGSGATASPAPPASAPTMAIPKGAGQVDLSGVAPAGFGSGAVTMRSLPKGAGQVDMSDAAPPHTAGSSASGTNYGAPQAGGHYVGAQWIPGTRSSTTEHGVDEARLAEGRQQRAIGDNYGTWAAEDTQKAAAREADADVAYAAAKQAALQQEAARQQRLANEKQAYVMREHEKLDALNVAAQQQVDPEAAKGSAGAQLFAALGIALGQFGASLNGGQNTALQIVNANIDRRIAAQEKNIANAHKSLANEQSLYKDNLEAFGDRERAVLATKIQMLDQAKAITDQQYAAAKSNRNDAAYHATSAALAKDRAETADRFGILTQDKHTTQANEHYFPGGVVGATASHEAKEDARAYSKALEEAKIPTALATLQDVDQRLDAMGSGDIAGVGPIKDHIPAALLSKTGAANRQAIQAIKNDIGHAKFGGALSPTESEKLDRELEGAHDAASLRNVVQSFRRSLHNKQGSIAAGYSEEGRALYHSRGGTVPDIRQDRPTTPYQRPVDGTRPDEGEPDAKPQYRTKR